MQEQPLNQENPEDYIKPKKTSLFKCFVIVLLLLLAWHLIAPLFGIAVGLGGITLTVVIATISILCVAVVLSFVWVGLTLLFIGLFSLAWIIVAVLLFPILLPFLIPAFLIVVIVRLFFLNK